MNDPRYPIGKFKSVRRALSSDERSELIEAIRETPAWLRAAVTGLSDAQLDTPDRDGGWTVRQVVHHVVDSHVNAYCRFKLAATEDHPTIRTYEEKEWAELPDTKLPPEASLAILDALHPRWVAFLDAAEPGYFERTLHYPGVGDVPVDMLLEIYGWHGRHHTAHVTSLRERSGW
ncbi:MAG TPA: putative metal-dependent hydrolase [Longimicrobiales bacterium]|nr:putative metal-dependent hydrolase [Longimicrobiales bacterium]